MSAINESFAICGAEAMFDEAVPIGQLYFPSWERYEASMRGIFEREYYTNNGPLLTKLEGKLQEFFGIRNVVCVTNGTLGLMMAAEALELSGKVILPSFTFIASAQSLSWAGIEPVFCDVEPSTHQIAIDQLDELIDDQVSGIMGVNLWGGACDPERLERYAKDRGLKLYFDSAHAFGCETDGKKIGGFGSLEVFSFHATKILSATEGGCVCTNDDDLANRLRSIRPSYGGVAPTNVVKVANARMSEAQAAIALLSLEDFEVNQKNNEKLFCVYDEMLSSITGIKLIKPAGVTRSNYQYVVCEIDELNFGMSRDSLIEVLKAENVMARRYFYPGVHNSVGFRKSGFGYASSLPVTDYLCGACIQLPIGAMIDTQGVGAICEIIDKANRNASYLQPFLTERKQ